MSEIIPGIEAVPPPTPRESAVVAVLRRGPEGWEVLLGLRSGKSSFFPRNWALPGGSLEAEDDPDAPGAHARCAARELFEETGIAIGAEKLVSVGVKTTPPFHPIRYRTEFFVTPAPPGLTLPANAPSPDENEDLRFWLAAEALEAWDRGEIHFPPPLPPLLRAFARERAARFDQLPRLLAVVSAEIGLKAMLPQSFTQSSSRMRGRTGALKPAATSAAESAMARSLRLPSGSPRVKRSP